MADAGAGAPIRTPQYALRPHLEALEGTSMRIRPMKDGAEIHDLSKRAAHRFVSLATLSALQDAGFVDAGTGRITEAGRQALVTMRYGAVPGVSAGGTIAPVGPGGPDPRKGGR